jgi:hypothetical protein
MRMNKVKDKEIVVKGRPFPLFGILGLIFITLKLTGYITWSWWWVLAPFWAPLAIVLAFFALVFVAAGVSGIFDKSGR